ncbi:hypothetical protein [Streptomyces zagrosensis]|uniref:Uncharacterized protein n=1 Tax=Streptomyces zagrosensis TaxID=1042984 RepID=A0A7W9QHC0_9ACTN|nr:hypothetical protein [Streptomyces zagrosensis]MBB5939949.1 hypothetical protein [Streptomyces zagrosensis]
MIEHTRRALARLKRAAPGGSIPLPLPFQTAVVGIFLTFRFGSVLAMMVLAVAVIWPGALPPAVQMLMTAQAWSDRSAVSFVKTRHIGRRAE